MGSDDREWIEIELTSHPPSTRHPSSGGRRRRRNRRTERPVDGPELPDVDPPGGVAPAGAVATDDPSRPSAGPDRSPADDHRRADEHRRTVVVAAIVGVVGLAFGWVLGRAGGDDGSAVPERSPVTTAAQRRPVPDEAPEALPGTRVEVGATVDAAASATTIAAERESVAADLRSPVDIAPQLRAFDLTLVGVTPDNRLVDLELGDGVQRVRRPERLTVDSDRIYAGHDWVGIPSFAASALRILGNGGSDDVLDISDPWSIVHDPTTGVFWTDANQGAMARRIDEVLPSGRPTGRSITLPDQATPLTSDRGALVVQIAGVVYRVTPDASEVIARGDLIGLSDDVAVVYACDDSLTCGVVTVDRATGETRPVPIDTGAPGPQGGVFVAMSSFSSVIGGAVSPDSRWVTVARFDSDRRLEFGVLELATGRFDVLPGGDFVSSGVWTPDGRYLIYLVSGELRAYDVSTGVAIEVAPAIDYWAAVTARPS